MEYIAKVEDVAPGLTDANDAVYLPLNSVDLNAGGTTAAPV